MPTPEPTAATVVLCPKCAEYLTPWRHVIDLLEAADALVATAANTAALFDDDLEADCDAAHRQIEQATETAYRDAEAQRAS